MEFWQIVTAVATLVSTIAYIVTVMYIRAELKSLEKDRYLNVTGELFSIWQSGEFMESQLWLLHRLQETTWQAFIAAHRADTGEIAFHRVGSFYDRVGTLVKMGLVNEQEILSTLGGHAIAVWQKIEPLVREARAIENSVMFDHFEQLMPACYECYVPMLGRDTQVKPFSLEQPSDRIKLEKVRARFEKGEPMTFLDVRHREQVEKDPRTLPNALFIPIEELRQRYTEIPQLHEVIAYCA
ncbi:MAG TPA: hypothetical protein VKU00_08370 [Chthonomonadaceae bacterium]|nr:hypothetical protein [Chthonomonadaceae bacterium]